MLLLTDVKILGISELINLQFPTQALINDRETYQKVVQIIRSVKPDVIFCHYGEDKHREHHSVAAEVPIQPAMLTICMFLATIPRHRTGLAENAL